MPGNIKGSNFRIHLINYITPYFLAALYLDNELRGDSPSFEAVTAVVSRAFRDGALSCAISERASPPAVSFRRHLPVKLSHWHRPTDSVGRLLVCPPRRTGPYAACLRGSSQMNARQRFTDRLPAFGKCLGRKSLTFFRKPKSAEM